MLMAKADRATAIVLLALGLAMVVGGWTMDRLEIRQIHPASIPGLLPMILGGLLSLCAVLLWRASSGSSGPDNARLMTGGSWARLGLTTGLCIVYALGLIGTLSYFWATAIFTFAFSLIFSYPVGGAPRARALSVASAAVLAFGVALGSALLFEELFLVRLP